MTRRRLHVAAVGLILVLVLVLLGGCQMTMRAWQIRERPEGPCIDPAEFEELMAGYPDAGDYVGGQELTGEWSWEHFGWECVRTWRPSGRTETVYVR